MKNILDLLSADYSILLVRATKNELIKASEAAMVLKFVYMVDEFEIMRRHFRCVLYYRIEASTRSNFPLLHFPLEVNALLLRGISYFSKSSF